MNRYTNHFGRVPIGLLPFLMMLTVSFAACGGHADNKDSDPIAECVQYQDRMNTCLGQHYSLPLAALNKSMSTEERKQARTQCIQNLQRLRVACR
jgi:hypothetical protein